MNGNGSERSAERATAEAAGIRADAPTFGTGVWHTRGVKQRLAKAK